MGADRITQLRIAGLRTIADLTLDLRGLTVLIGENGTGKSTILEALELIRKAERPVRYLVDVIEAHGGLRLLLRRGAKRLKLGVTIEGAGPRMDYEITIGQANLLPTIEAESLDVFADPDAKQPLHVIRRSGDQTQVFDVAQRRLVATTEAKIPQGAGFIDIDRGRLALPQLHVLAQPAVRRTIEALSRIEVHVPFDVRPVWQQRELDREGGLRWPTQVAPASDLWRYAANLANTYQQLRNMGDDVWSRVRDRVRLGLGEDYRDFQLKAVQPGLIELLIVRGSAPDDAMPVSGLSEGQLSYLAFLAMVELHAERAVLAFDEPESHLHPALLARVVEYFEEVAAESPVLLATHSDGLLDALGSPDESVAICELDTRQETQLRRVDSQRLGKWLADYRGLGALRAEGLEAHVLRDPPAAKPLGR